MTPDTLKLTKNQKLVLGRLETARTPLGAYAILDDLRGEGLRAPLQVYRALDKLMDAGLVHRIESLNAFVACSTPDCGRHETTLFMLCEICGAVDEFVAPDILEALDAVCAAKAFQPDKKTVEIRGACADCAN